MNRHARVAVNEILSFLMLNPLCDLAHGDALLTEWEMRLEEVLLEYVKLYGLSDKARALFLGERSFELGKAEAGSDQRSGNSKST